MIITAFAAGLRRLSAHALTLTICTLALITTSACSGDNSARKHHDPSAYHRRQGHAEHRAQGGL